MPKLKDFAEAKRKFKNNEDDAISYFILVESYGKHLNANQKDGFLNPESIDTMLNVLDEKQLKHLKNLIRVFVHYRDPNGYHSEWFQENIYQNKNLLKNSIEDLHEKCETICEILFDRIENVIQQRLKTKNIKAEQLTQYKTMLRKFDGNSVEYRQWLLLLVTDHGIPGIDKIYDIDKLLRRLSVDYLKKLKTKLSSLSCFKAIKGIKNIEPYLYDLATQGMDASLRQADPNPPLNNPDVRAFRFAKKNLTDQIIDAIIAKKTEIDIGDKVTGLPTSDKFYDDMEAILDASGISEDYLKNAIEEYSRAGTNGKTFNHYLRKEFLLKKLSEAKVSVSDVRAFRSKVLKAREYFLKNLTSKGYTVYRGMGKDGLKALLDNSDKEIPYKTDDKNIIIDENLIRDINEKKPTVFDEGFVSTSLNPYVAAVTFKGKKLDNVFLTIKVPTGSKALVLDFNDIQNIPREEELLLAPRTKMRIDSMKRVGEHFELELTVIN